MFNTMLRLQDIRSLTDFQRNAKLLVQQIKETHQVLVLTVNGKASVVVQDAESYQELLDRLERAEAIAAVQEALSEFDRGEGQPARVALESLRSKYDIPC
jgi:prevent-host-death family protein